MFSRAVGRAFLAVWVACAVYSNTAVAELGEAEPTQIGFSAAASSVDESQPYILIKVTRSGDLTITSTVHYATEDQTARAGTDYTPAIDTLTFQPGAVEQFIWVRLLPNDVPSENLVFGVRLTEASAPAILSSSSLHDVTLVDNDKPGQFRFQVEASQWNENAGKAFLKIVREGGRGGDVSVSYRLQSGSAQQGADFDGAGGTVTFPSGQTSKVFGISILNDTFVEPNEDFVVVLEKPTGGATLGQPVAHTVAIVSEDSPPTLAFATADSVISESKPTAKVIVRRTGDVSQGVSVGFQSIADNALEGQDYTPVSGTLTFAPNVTEQTITIPILNDTLTEEPERFAVRLSAPSSGALLGSKTSHELSIVSEDGPSLISFLPGPSTVDESGGSVRVRVVWSGSSAYGNARVKVCTVEESAHRYVDFTEGPYTVDLNFNEVVKEFTVAIRNDQDAEGTEQFLLQLEEPEFGAALGREVTRVIEILDDEPPAFDFVLQRSTISEVGETITVDIWRFGNLSIAATAKVSVVGLSATAGVDFNFAPVEVDFEPNCNRKSITVSALADEEQEFGESFELVLDRPLSGRFEGRHRVTIVDANPPKLLRGSYHGILSDWGATGGVTLNIAAGGYVTGVIQIPEVTYRIKGRFAKNGTFVQTFPGSKRTWQEPATLALELSADGDAVLGTFAWQNSRFISVVTKRDREGRAPEAGYYTAHLGGTAYPFGFWKIRVHNSGRATIAGLLQTDRRVTASAHIAEDGTMAVYIGNRLGDFIAGWTRFDATQGRQLSGALNGGINLNFSGFRTGYDDAVTLVGAPYTPVQHGRILDDFDAVGGEATMSLTQEVSDSFESLEIPFSWRTKNHATFAQPNDAKASIRFSPATGLWSGQFKDSSGKLRMIRGICVQHPGAGQDLAGGYYFAGYHSHFVQLVPRQP